MAYELYTDNFQAIRDKYGIGMPGGLDDPNNKTTAAESSNTWKADKIQDKLEQA